MNKSDKVQNGKQRDYGKEPSRFIYTFSVFLLRFFLKPYINARFKVAPEVYKLEKPIIVIANHPSYFDPFLVGVGLRPMKVNFLAADNYFRKPWMRWLVYNAGAIPKIQFRADPTAMKAMIRVIKRKGILGIFPEGTRTTTGKLMPIEESFTKFIKKIEANVIYVNSKGAYMTWPRWSLSGMRRGRINIDINILATGDEIKNTTLENLHQKIIQALSFDEYKMQKENPHVFKSKAPARGLHNILHQCPKCRTMWSMRTSDFTLYCTTCGNTALMDKYGLLKPLDESCKVFETVSDWNDWQLENLKPMLSDDNFFIADTALMLQSEKESGFVPAGRGIIRLADESFEFIPDRIIHDDGSINNSSAIKFPISGIWGISSDYGVYFDLVGEKMTYRFTLDNGQKALSFSQAVELIRSKK